MLNTHPESTSKINSATFPHDVAILIPTPQANQLSSPSHDLNGPDYEPAMPAEPREKENKVNSFESDPLLAAHSVVSEKKKE